MAATNAQITSFIKLLGSLAVNECNRRIAAGQGFVLPSICIAQSALETGYGTAGIMTRANAFFGIKAGGSWTGKVYSANTREVYNGVEHNIVANFRAYDSLEDSVADYYDMMTRLNRYANGISYGSDKSQWKTPRETITAFHNGGYATEPTYVSQIMDMVEYRKMYEWDDLVTGEGALPVGASLTFTRDDFIQGSLIYADSGRSIMNDRNVKSAVALDWANAREIANGSYKISGIPEGYNLYVAFTTADRATISIAAPGDVNITDVLKIGIYLESADGSDISPADLSKDLMITISNSSYPSSAEAYTGVLAYFVKVE